MAKTFALASAKKEMIQRVTADYSNSKNEGLQMGQNYGTVNASFNSDSIQNVTIASGASVYLDGKKKSNEEKLLDLLISNDPTDRHDIKRPDAGTCQWIFQNEIFLDWVKTEPSKFTPLHVHGIPGSGKSVLLKFLISELQTRLRQESTSPSSENTLPTELGVPGKTLAVGCFCDDKNEKRRTPIWILRTLLYRLFRQNQNLVKYALLHCQDLEALDASDPNASDPDAFQSLDVLQKIFEDIATDPEIETIYLVVDGLDQCGPYLPGVIRLIEELSERINGKSSSTDKKFSVRWITSDRSNVNTREKLRSKHIIDMAKENRSDIDTVIERRISSIQEYHHFSENLGKDITSQLKDRSEGMFMWLSLILDDLATWEGIWTESGIKEKLQSIPRDVETFYGEILKRQSRDVVSKLRTLQMWTFFACRPLTLKELNVVLTLSEGKEYTGGESSEDDLEALRHRIENSWGSLFAVHDGAVHLSHQSVKDFLSYLFSDEGLRDYPSYGVIKTMAHRQIASACLTYLRLDEIQKREVPKPPVNDNGMIDQSQLAEVQQGYLKGFPFLQYSVEFVGNHLRESQIKEETDVPGMEETFKTGSKALLTWVKSYDLLKRWTYGKYSGASSSTSLLFVSTRLNLPWLAEQVTTWNKYNIRGVLSDVRAPDLSGWSAIHIAADSEAVEMVAWLIKNGAFVDAETMGLAHPGRTALHFAAAKRSDAGSQMVQELLKGKANANARTRQGGNTPLHYAIDGRSIKTVEALLSSSADVNIANNSGLTALHKAVAVPGLEDIVEALLKSKADPNRKTVFGTVKAARATLKAINSQSLAQTYYDTNTSQAALHIAAKAKDSEKTIEVLLKHGADVNCRDSAERTPLHAAVIGMDQEINTKLLINSGADVDAKDNQGKTPLLLFLETIGAITTQLQGDDQAKRLVSEFVDQASLERTMDILLSAGANPSAEGKDGKTSISCAKEAELNWALDRLTKNTVQPTASPTSPTSPESPESPQLTISTAKASGETSPDSETKTRSFLGSPTAAGSSLMKSGAKWLPKRTK